jgi:hypothetical protein
VPPSTPAQLAYARAHRERRRADPERQAAFLAYQAEYSASPEHKARERERATTPEYKAQKSTYAATSEAKAKRHAREATPHARAMRAACEARRRSIKLGAEQDGHSLAELDGRFVPYCTFCFQPLTLAESERDHWRPLRPNDGGPPGGHTLSNLSHQHPACNRHKNAHVLADTTLAERLDPILAQLQGRVCIAPIMAKLLPDVAP